MKVRRGLTQFGMALCAVLSGDVAFAQQSPTCAPQSTYANYEWIAGVKLGQRENASTGKVYSDFSAQQGIFDPIVAGSSVSFTLRPGFSGSSYPEYWSVYLDTNGDQSYSSSERILAVNGKTSLSASVQIPPLSVPSGAPVRMRVMMKYGSYATSPCERFTYGEVEDYTVIAGGVSTRIDAFLASGTGFGNTVRSVSYDTATANWQVTGEVPLPPPQVAGQPPLSGPVQVGDITGFTPTGSSLKLAVINGQRYDSPANGTYLSIFDPIQNSWSHRFIAGTNPTFDGSIVSDGSNRIFLPSISYTSTPSGGFAELAVASNTVTRYAQNREMFSLARDSAGSLYAMEPRWVSGTSVVIHRFSSAPYQIAQTYQLPLSGYVSDMAIDTNGDFLLPIENASGSGSVHALLRVKQSGSIAQEIPLPAQSPRGLPFSVVDLERCGNGYVAVLQDRTISGPTVDSRAFLAFIDLSSGEVRLNSALSVAGDAYLLCPAAISPPTPPTEPSYCASKAMNSSLEFLNRIDLNEPTAGTAFANPSGNNGGYGNFTTLGPIRVRRGASVSYSVTPGFPSSVYSEVFRMWADFNRNGTFEDSEEVMARIADRQVTGSFAVPVNAATGTVRLRVSMFYGANPTPCATGSYGEVEDYTLLVE